jgi:hypothetical protein
MLARVSPIAIRASSSGHSPSYGKQGLHISAMWELWAQTLGYCLVLMPEERPRRSVRRGRQLVIGFLAGAPRHSLPAVLKRWPRRGRPH